MSVVHVQGMQTYWDVT